MRFLGIDFAWMGKPSGLAALDYDGSALLLTSLDRLTPLQKIVHWAQEHLGNNGCVIGIDAPLIIPNQTGMRPCDRQMHQHYGRFHAGAYPANLGLPAARRPLELSHALAHLGFAHGTTLVPQSSGRFQIEVHPHAASVQLFDLPQIVEYKKGTVAERRAGLVRYRQLLVDRLHQLTPAVHYQTPLPEVPCTSPEMKALEDRLDALMASYIAAYWWYWGLERNTIHGDAGRGYIIVPHRLKA